MSSPSDSSTDAPNDSPRKGVTAGPKRPPEDGRPLVAVVLFLATTFTCFMVYGTQWAAGDPLTDPEVAADSARFAFGLMAILLAHEMGHYLVARRHGFRLSLPYFLPLPFAFGTLGAIIRLKTLPRSRTALLEMGAAGPIAGFVVALGVLALGMPEITAHPTPEMPLQWPPDPVPPPADWLVSFDAWLAPRLEQWPWNVIFPVDGPGEMTLFILANPPAMDLVGEVVLGRVPGRYDSLGPLGLAGWAGCLLTGINLVPIGQLDGGHIFTALAPRHARRLSRVLLVVVFLAGVLWMGWVVWALLLLGLRAWIGLDVPERPGLTPRARFVAVAALVCMLLSLMPRPFELERLGLDEIRFVDQHGDTVSSEEIEAWRSAARVQPDQ